MCGCIFRKPNKERASQSDVSYVHAFRIYKDDDDDAGLVRRGPFGGEHIYNFSAKDDLTHSTCTFAPVGERPKPTIR